ncbi:MAG: hypothetical protein OEV40_19350 [Acidimicrobiia bacterium]|nr:hypothetical protein [Acidimicrobiia bacterium]
MTNGDTAPDRLDDLLLAELRQAVNAADPVPGRLLDSAKAAFTWRTVDQELAHLQFDSLADADSEVAVRSARTVRLSFATERAAVEVEVDDAGLVGQIVPPPDGLRVLLRSGDRIDVSVDEVGQFATDRPPTSPIRLEATFGELVVITEWFGLS